MVGQKDPNEYDSGLIGDPINHKCMPGGGGGGQSTRRSAP